MVTAEKASTELDEVPSLAIEVYDGMHCVPGAEGNLLCRLEGSVAQSDAAPLTLLEEVNKVLELCEGRYGAPESAEGRFTAFVFRGLSAIHVMRISVKTTHGTASAHLAVEAAKVHALPEAPVGLEDDVLVILRKVTHSRGR